MTILDSRDVLALSAAASELRRTVDDFMRENEGKPVLTRSQGPNDYVPPNVLTPRQAEAYFRSLGFFNLCVDFDAVTHSFALRPVDDRTGNEYVEPVNGYWEP